MKYYYILLVYKHHNLYKKVDEGSKNRGDPEVIYIIDEMFK